MHLFDGHAIPQRVQKHSLSLHGLILPFCFALIATFVVDTYYSHPARAEGNEATAVHATFGLEYAVPNGPRNLTEEAPGRIWYTSPEAGGIGFLEVITETDTISGTDPLTGTENSIVRYRTDFYGFGEKSEPYDLVYDDGFVWFTLRGLRALGKMDVATREVEIFTLLSVGAAPTGIAVAPDGKLWIAQSNGRISRFDPVTETFLEFVMSNALAEAPRMEDVAYQNARSIWFTMPDGNRVVVYDSVRDRFFNIPTVDAEPMGISVDPNGVVWITDYGSNQIGRYSPTTVSIWIWFESLTPEGGPGGILTFLENGSLQVWLTENKVGKIGRLQYTSSFVIANQEQLGPNTPAGNTWGIIRTSDGHIWVADTGRNLLYELTSPFIHRVYVTSVENGQSPTD